MIHPKPLPLLWMVLLLLCLLLLLLPLLLLSLLLSSLDLLSLLLWLLHDWTHNLELPEQQVFIEMGFVDARDCYVAR